MKKKLRVVHVISDLPFGGVEKFLLDLLPRFQDNLHVSICCIREKGKLAPDFERRGIKVDLCFFKGRLHPQSIINLRNYLKENRVDVVHTHMYRANTSGTVSSRIAGIPVIISHLHSYPEWDTWRQKKMDAFLSNFKDHIIAVSESVKKNFIEATNYNKDKITTIYNGVDLSRFAISYDIDAKRKSLGIPRDAKVVGIFARLIEDKRHRVFLESAKDVLKIYGKNLYFLIVGKGPLDSELKDLAVKSRIMDNVIFTGLRDDVPELLQMTDISVLTSRREGFPIIILESMASGVPFISTDAGGVGEIIKDGESGFVVPIESPQALAEAMIKLLHDEKLQKRFSETSKRIVKSYTIESNVTKLTDLYLNLYRRKSLKQ